MQICRWASCKTGLSWPPYTNYGTSPSVRCHPPLTSLTNLLYHKDWPNQSLSHVYFQPGAHFLSVDCNREKARIMNHPAGSVPLNQETAAQTKNICWKGGHVRWASVAALEFLQRSHDREDHYTGTKEPATCASLLKQRRDAPFNI